MWRAVVFVISLIIAVVVGTDLHSRANSGNEVYDESTASTEDSEVASERKLPSQTKSDNHGTSVEIRAQSQKLPMSKILSASATEVGDHKSGGTTTRASIFRTKMKIQFQTFKCVFEAAP